MLRFSILFDGCVIGSLCIGCVVVVGCSGAGAGCVVVGFVGVVGIGAFTGFAVPGSTGEPFCVEFVVFVGFVVGTLPSLVDVVGDPFVVVPFGAGVAVAAVVGCSADVGVVGVVCATAIAVAKLRAVVIAAAPARNFIDPRPSSPKRLPAF